MRSAILLACGLAFAPRPTSAAEVKLIVGADKLLRPGARLFFGELHGTEETPAFVGEMARLASKLSPVRVGLEIVDEEQPAIDRYLTSTGSEADRKALVAGKFWTDAFQDGRRSRAMVGLLESMRALKHGGADVGVFAFDGHFEAKDDRDLGMATRAHAAITLAPKAIVLLLAGNLHARKTQGQLKQTWMAMRLVERGVELITLDARYAGGSAWFCTGPTPSDCGPHPLLDGEAHPRGIVLDGKRDDGYDGVFDVGRATASPPAHPAH